MAEEYLKLFDTTAQRLAYEDGEDYVEPYVSYTEGDRQIHYNKGIDYTEALTFKVTSGGTITFKKTNADAPTVALQYKKNDGEWTPFTSSTAGTNINVVAGDKVMFRGNNAQYGVNTTNYNTFSGSTAGFTLQGNIMSLINSENFANLTTLESAYTFVYLFRGCTGLTNASKLALPATALTEGCYISMFFGCTSLTKAPELPATTLTTSCYAYMFQGCSSLTTAPALPATTLAESCYSEMFRGCTRLRTAPALPATALTIGCYYHMFRSCTSLTTAPELPAATLVSNCYFRMFYECSKLNYIKAMFTTTPSSAYTNGWVYGVAPSGTFVKNSHAEWTTTGTNAVPYGWTVETASE